MSGDPVAQFISAIAAAGLSPPANISADGAIHRFSTNGRRGDDSGWYIAHTDGTAAGAFGCWRTGLQSSWCAKSDSAMTAAELADHRQRIKTMQAQREADLLATHQQARQTAAALWSQADAVTAHPYLSSKGVQPHGLRVFADKLLIPLRDTAGKLLSLQTIAPDGDKRFHPGGRVKGCYHSIGKPAGVLIVCEGYATGASIHEATGHAVAVAFNAGNLQAVALALRAKYPALKIMVAADDDHLTDGNPGMSKATAAALAVGGLVAVPVFPTSENGRPDKATDFNDLHLLAGADAVKACMDGAINSIAACARPDWATGINDAWPEPTPLPNALPPVDAFDAELLPVALRGWVMDIAHRMQCPADFPAVAALVALSSLIGARAVVQPKARDDWQVVPNLWGAVVGRPGVKKSPALSEALKPLNRLQADEFERWQLEHDAWALDCKVMAMQDDANEKKAKGLAGKDPAAARALLEPVDTPAEPVARRYIVNDATVEKLGELMQQNPWGTLSYRDELYGLLTGLDKPGQEGSRAFYLQSYDGNQGYTFDRIGRGTVHIPRVCLAMIGGIQPGRIQEYVRSAVSGGSADDGLLQRFGLAVWPDITGEFVHVDQWPDTPAKQTAWAVFERLADLQPANDTDPQVWRFDDAAQALFVEWLVPFETEIRGDDLHPAMVSHLSKYRKLIPALALVFALIDTPDSGGLIHERELIRALSFGDYLRTHANRLYAAAVAPETTDAVTLLSRIKAGKLVDRDGVMLDSFTPRQVALKHWAGLGTPDAVRKAADVLADYDWLRRVLVPGGAAGGRPSERYTINPMTRGVA
jgi:putative DNA primase/helicase